MIRFAASPLFALIASLLVLALSSAPAEAQTPQYRFTELPLPGGFYMQAFGLNEKGQVVGNYFDDTGTISHAYVYDKGVTTDLGTLGGPHAWAYGINDSGQITGWSSLPGDAQRQVFLFTPGAGMQGLGALGGIQAEGRAINNAGQIVGFVMGPGFVNQAIGYSDGVLAPLGNTESGDRGNFAYAINNSGQAAGSRYVSGFEENGVLYALSGSAETLGFYGGEPTTLLGLNDRGQAVGYAGFNRGGAPEDARRALLYTPGVGYTELGTLPGGRFTYATDVNNRGQIVGFAGVAGSNRPFLYENGQISDLSTLIVDLPVGVELYGANAINDAGQIIGVAQHGLQLRSFLLTPVTSAGAAPEPSALALTCVGLFTGALLRRRFRA